MPCSAGVAADPDRVCQDCQCVVYFLFRRVVAHAQPQQALAGIKAYLSDQVRCIEVAMPSVDALGCQSGVNSRWQHAIENQPKGGNTPSRIRICDAGYRDAGDTCEALQQS